MNKLLVLISIIVASFFVSQNAYAHHALEEIPVSNTPMQMSLTDDFLYVASFEYPHITIVDTKTSENVGFITTSSSANMAVEAVPSQNKIYVAPFESGGIDVYDLTTKIFIKTITLPDSEITMSSTSGQLYGHRSDIHFLTGGWSLDHNPVENHLYVADYNNHQIYVIDIISDEVTESIEVPRHPFSVKVDPTRHTVIVASLAGNEISFLEDVTGETSVKPAHAVIKSIKVAGGPWGIDVDPTMNRAYVTNRGCECLTVIDIDSMEIVGDIPLGDKGQAIAVDTAEHQIYVSYLTQNKMVKIDGEMQAIVLTYDLQDKLWDIVVDPNNHKVYSTLKTQDKVLVLGPESYSINLPVVTTQSPSAYVGMLHAHGQDVKASLALLDLETKQLSINLETEDGGKIAIGIPKDVLDSRNGIESAFDVTIDGNIVSTQEIIGMAHSRVISVQVPANAQSMTITGNLVVQEFDTSLQTATPTKSLELTDGSKVICEGKVWMEKTNGKIACVLPSTAEKLVERGWGTILE